MTGDGSNGLLEVRDLVVRYRSGRLSGGVTALDGVDLTIADRETVGLVGESGSGKSTLARAILGLVPAAAGTIRFAGQDITNAPYRRRRRLGGELQVVFQDPYSSLNPTRTIGQSLIETAKATTRAAHGDLLARAGDMLERVGMGRDVLDRFPSQFSGGQRQRIAIARALIAEPRLVVCDEAVSALDLSVQAQVLNLLADLQEALQLSYLFISHDLGVVRHIAHRVVVLYRGVVVEEGSSDRIYHRPMHPYTRLLLDAAPLPDPGAQRRRRAEMPLTITGAPAQPAGCRFAPRCPHAAEICRRSQPRLEPALDGVSVACHRWQEIDSATPVHVGPDDQTVHTNVGGCP